MNGEIAQICKCFKKKEAELNINLFIMKKNLLSYFLIIKNIRLKVLKNGLIIVLIEGYKILSS